MIACKREIPYEVYSNWNNRVASDASEDEQSDATDIVGNVVVKLEPGVAKFSTIEKGKGSALSSKVEGTLIAYFLQYKY